MDLSKFLKLIRRYLEAGVISPLLSNIMLNDLDQELEARGHKFVRYADDFQVFVKSKRAGKRVMKSLTKFLGFGFYKMQGKVMYFVT
jgi:retron-type reverse transcriptase